MSFWHTVALLGLLAAVPTNAWAQSLLEIAAGLKFCRTLKDDAQRLKCFDGLISEQQQGKADGTKPERDITWKIEDSKSPLDDSPEIVASLPAINTSALLMIRCKEKKTEVIFGPADFVYFGSDPVRVFARIGDGKLIETRWNASTQGRAVFAPSAVSFIRALPDNGKLFLRAHSRDGARHDGEFELGNVSEVRERVAAACRWPKG